MSASVTSTSLRITPRPGSALRQPAEVHDDFEQQARRAVGRAQRGADMRRKGIEEQVQVVSDLSLHRCQMRLSNVQEQRVQKFKRPR